MNKIAITTAICYLVSYNISFASTDHRTTTNNFTFIEASDPQPYRADENPGDTGDPNATANRVPWKAVIEPTYLSMKYIGAQFMIINGDMTEYGRSTTWIDTKNMFKKANIKVFFGLGNHDIHNNLNDCKDDNIFRNKNQCAVNSMNELYTFVQYGYDGYIDPPGVSYDAKSESSSSTIGSFAYSFDRGNIHFVQLNNYPQYTVNKISGRKWFPGKWSRNDISFTITSALPWLEQDLTKAQLDGKRIILNYHQSAAALDSKEFKDILSKFKIDAIFAGHVHAQIYNSNYFNNIPLFESAALFNGGYYKVDVDAEGMTVDSIQGETGSPVSTGAAHKYRVKWQ